MTTPCLGPTLLKYLRSTHKGGRAWCPRLAALQDGRRIGVAVRPSFPPSPVAFMGMFMHVTDGSVGVRLRLICNLVLTTSPPFPIKNEIA